MDTRAPIQVAPEPPVYSVIFNELSTRFVCGLDNGLRIFRTSDCVRTLKEAPVPGHGIAIAVSLDDRYIAVVGGGRRPNTSPNKLSFWDNVEAKKVNEIDLAEPILGVRMTATVLAVVLKDRTVCLQYGKFGDSNMLGPTSVVGLHDTAPNPYALCCVRGDKIALPGLTPGQVQIAWLTDKTKKIIRAHSSELRQMDLSRNGEVLTTASRQGTLIRVFSTSTLSQTHEFRRGVDTAIIYSLSISPSNHFVAATSDKGTIHVFDLRPPANDDTQSHLPRRRSTPRPAATQRPRPNSTDFDALSQPSGTSASSPRPSILGGFYGPPPDLAHTPPKNAPSAFAALAKFPGMPRALTDVRSMTSISYHLGSDPPNWQGQPAYTSTTLPNGASSRVKNPNVPIPGLPDGKPPKGVLAWDPERPDRGLWCIGGGADARWEAFELREVIGEEGQGRRLKIVRRGWRAYLTRQFPEDETE